MKQNNEKILRLVLPQWQGGNRRQYYLGAKLLAWIAPKSDDETAEISVSLDSTENTEKDGIVAKEQLIIQTKEALKILNEKQPDKVIALGGDCSIELAPFAYLLKKYGNKDTAILWIDGYPDVTTVGTYPYPNYHAMILASLLDEGDKDFANLVQEKVKAENVVFAGINDKSEFDRAVYQKYQFTNFNSESFSKDSNGIISFLNEREIKNVIVHFDLDVLDLNEFRSQYFAEIPIYDIKRNELPKGSSIVSVVRLINDIHSNFNLIGLGITEHLPWDMIVLQNMLKELPMF